LRRSTLISLILFLLVAAGFWYTRQPENAFNAALAGTATPTAQNPAYLLETTAPTITGLRVEKSTGAMLQLRLQDGIWIAQNSSGPLAPLDQQSTASAIQQLRDLRILKELETQENPTAFGLASTDAHKLLVTFADGSSLAVSIGKLTVTGSGYYAQKSGQPQPILIISKLSLDALLALPEQPPLLETPLNSPESSVTPEE
jgi:hypothetical protein